MHAMLPAEFRDAVRHALRVPTASDTGGLVGEPGTMPYPTNSLIMQAANLELARQDTFGHLMPAQEYRFTLPANSSGIGPARISASDPNWKPQIGTGGIAELQYVGWLDTDATTYLLPLRLTNRRQVEIDYTGYLTEGASQPLYVWMEWPWIFVYPDTDVGGTLSATCTEGVGDWGASEADPMSILPPNLCPHLVTLTALQIAQGASEDTEMAAALQLLVPEAQVARERIQTFFASQNTGAPLIMRAPRYGRMWP